MNKMMRLFLVGTTVASFAVNVNAMNDNDSVVLDMPKPEEIVEIQATPQRSYRKYLIGTAVLATVVATIAADQYLNDGKITNKCVEGATTHVVTPAKKFASYLWNNLPTLRKAATSEAVDAPEATSSTLSWMSSKAGSALNTTYETGKSAAKSIWNNWVPSYATTKSVAGSALNGTKSFFGSAWSKMPAMPSLFASKAVEDATEAVVLQPVVDTVVEALTPVTDVVVDNVVNDVVVAAL